LSLGQKQLLCFARLWLRRRPFILMDEPTSAVDVVTDQKIQDLLHNEFHDETIITIAHRVNTLSRYDKIIEMANGKVISVR
jgi:ABC-type multidrug transport system fused ATPase/permease subunit